MAHVCLAGLSHISKTCVHIRTLSLSNHNTSCENKTTYLSKRLLTLNWRSAKKSSLCMWSHWFLGSSNRTAVLAPFCYCSRKRSTLFCRMIRRSPDVCSALRLHLSLLVCQLNACEVKMQKQHGRPTDRQAGVPPSEQNKHESGLLREETIFYCAQYLLCSVSPLFCISAHVWVLFNLTAVSTCPLL